MAPVAAGFAVLFVSLALLAALVGILGAAVSWRYERGHLRGGLSSAAAYVVLAAALLGSAAPALMFGLPALACFFLVTCFMARHLQARGLRPLWTTVVVLVGALGALCLYGLSFRLSLTAPLWLALAVALLLARRAWRARPRPAA